MQEVWQKSEKLVVVGVESAKVRPKRKSSHPGTALHSGVRDPFEASAEFLNGSRPPAG